MTDSKNVTTPRLLLSPMAPDDLGELFPIFHDPQDRTHDPAGRHLTVNTTAAFIEGAVARWPREGQSYWTVRLRSTDEVIAWIADATKASRRVAEKLRLVNYGERLDTNDRQPRLAFPDRPFDPVSSAWSA